MNGRGGLLIALGAILVIAGIAAFFLLSDDAGQGVDVALIDVGEVKSNALDLPDVALDERGPERIAIADISPADAPEKVASRSLPASYRAALAKVIGRVVLEDGTPVTDLDVMIGGGRLGTMRVPRDAFFDNPAMLEENAMLDVIAGRAVTDAEGRFEMTDVEPRTIGLVLLDPGGPRSHYTLLTKTPSTGSVTDLGDIVMPLGIIFRGRVVDEAGEPVVNARVRAAELPPFPGVEAVADVRPGSAVVVTDREVTFFYRPPERLMRLEKYIPVPTAYTNDAGEFVLESVPQGLISVLIDRIDRAPAMHGPTPSGAPGGERDLGDIRMDAGVAMVGHVVDGEGEPIAGAEVLAGNGVGGGMIPVTILKGAVFTDENGRFEVPGLTPTTGRVAAKSPERSTFVVSEEVVAGQDEPTIVIPQPLSITALVFDESDEPVSGVTFFGRSLPDMDADELPNFLKPPAAMPTRADEVDAGVYELEKLDPAVWEIAARVPGYGTAVEVIDLRESGRERIEFRLEGGAELSVTVASASDEEPIEHAMVDVFSPGEDFPIQSARTSANGVANFRDLPPGEVSLLVTHPALAVKEATATVRDDELTESVVLLDVGATIRGSVLDNGRAPAQPMMVTLTHDNDGIADFSDALIPLLTYTDRDGNFEFLDVDPGSLELQARPMFDQGLGPTAIGMMMSQSPLAKEELEVGPGADISTTLIVGSGYADIETGSLHGRLLVNGRPPQDWTVFVWGKIRRSAIINDDGTFDIGVVAAGDVELRFSAHGMNFSRGIAASETAQVAVGERKFIDVSVRVGSVSGRVISGDDGEPLEGIRLFAQQAESKGRSWGSSGAVSKADGSFEIDPIEAGEYTLNSWAEGYAAASSEPFEVGEMQRRTGLTLVVRRAIVVSGTVNVVGLDEDPSFMRLVAKRDDTGDQDGAWVDRETGEFEFDRLSPGQWTISLATEFDEEAFEPVTINVVQPLDDLVLTFNYSEPEPEPDDETKAQLQALGYVGDG